MMTTRTKIIEGLRRYRPATHAVMIEDPDGKYVLLGDIAELEKLEVVQAGMTYVDYPNGERIYELPDEAVQAEAVAVCSYCEGLGHTKHNDMVSGMCVGVVIIDCPYCNPTGLQQHPAQKPADEHPVGELGKSIDETIEADLRVELQKRGGSFSYEYSPNNFGGAVMLHNLWPALKAILRKHPRPADPDLLALVDELEKLAGSAHWPATEQPIECDCPNYRDHDEVVRELTARIRKGLKS